MKLFGSRKRKSPFGTMLNAGKWLNEGFKASTPDMANFLNEPKHIEIKRLKKAIYCFTKAMEFIPDDMTYASRGRAYFMLENYEQAISDYNRAIELNPDESRYYLERGEVYYNKKDYKKAWSDVYKAQKLGYCENIPFLADLLTFMESERWGKVEKI